MKSFQEARWIAVSALGAAMFSIGFSVTVVACSTRSASVLGAQRDADTSVSAAGSLPTVDSAQAVAPAASSATPARVTARGELKLHRVIVTRRIENREPVASSVITLGSDPVYAFVDLENPGPTARSIRLVFENEETKATVGHIKLAIPAGQSRFRTWGNTRLIRDPGHWVAVVSSADGVELGRSGFDVTG
jgi:hypothetical protein